MNFLSLFLSETAITFSFGLETIGMWVRVRLPTFRDINFGLALWPENQIKSKDIYFDLMLSLSIELYINLITDQSHIGISSTIKTQMSLEPFGFRQIEPSWEYWKILQFCWSILSAIYSQLQLPDSSRV